MIIAYFMYDSDTDTYCGRVVTFSHENERLIIRPSQSCGAESPDYDVICDTLVGDIDYGEARWLSRSHGIDRLAVLLDDPWRTRAATLIRRHGDTHAVLNWTRPNTKPSKVRRPTHQRQGH